MDKMKIEIWSDIACPYCYIGKRKLENALAKFPHRDSVSIEWHSYELSPELPKKASDKTFYEYFAEAHSVDIDEARKGSQAMIELAKSVGLEYDFEKLVVTSTSNALRLVKLATRNQLADEAEEVLFKAYFVDGENVSDRDTLIRLGTQIGLVKEDIVSMLESDIYLKEIEKDIEYSENGLNLEFIPFYLFNNKHVVQGSIAEEEYLEILTKSYDEWKVSGVSSERGDMISGQSCSIDGVCS